MIGKKVRRRLFIVIVMISVLAQLVSAQGSLLANEIVSAHADEWWLDDEKEPLPTIVYDDLTDQEKLIWNYYDTVNVRDEQHPDGDWEKRVDLTAPSERNMRNTFSSNETNRKLHMGIFNLESSRLVYIQKVETAPADQNTESTKTAGSVRKLCVAAEVVELLRAYRSEQNEYRLLKSMLEIGKTRRYMRLERPVVCSLQTGYSMTSF